MNYFLLILFIVALGIGGYYGFTSLENERIDAQHKIGEQREQLDWLEAQNKELEADKTRVSKADWDAAQAKIADLTKQLQAAQSALEEAKKAALAAAAAATNQAADAAAPPPPPPPPPLPSNNLGTIKTADGKTYQNCQLLKVKADGIVVNESEGVLKILYAELPSDLQKRFGYDPHAPTDLTEDQVQFLENQRIGAAAQAAGN